MEQTNQAEEVEIQTETLESEVKAFAESLPYFAKFLCEKLLSSTSITDNEIDIAYSYLLEDAGLKEKTERVELIINCTGDVSTTYKSDLVLTQLQNLQGVNALVENQIIQFGPNLTIIYGINGSGKSGYIRLLKKVFFNRAEEQIIENVHIATGHKKIGAEFIFTSNSAAYTLTYPENCTNAEFRQFSVFDSKCVPIHLNNKNQFEFKPSGLNFFADLTNAIKKVEERINTEINVKSTAKDYPCSFEGDSDLKSLLFSLTAKTKIDDLKKHLPFSEEDKVKRKQLEEKKAILQAQKKDKEITELEEKKSLLNTLKESIQNNNKYFTLEKLTNAEAAASKRNFRQRNF